MKYTALRNVKEHMATSSVTLHRPITEYMVPVRHTARQEEMVAAAGDDGQEVGTHLTHEAALIAANTLVGSRLDYYNSLFRGLSALDLRKGQCVQNSLARIVANTTKYSHITPVRKALHWLPIKYRSIFKTAELVYKFLNSGNPKYFEPFLIPRHSAYNTHRSQSDGMFLEVPHFASVFKSQKHFGLSFAYDAPMIWNDLPDEVCSANSLASFRSKL